MEPRPFARRIGASPAWMRIAFRMGRGRLALSLALLPALALLAAAILHEPVLDETRVRDTFARYISGLITAATIAVGFAALSLRRAIKGIGEITEHVRADREYAERIARVTGATAPMSIGLALDETLAAVERRASEIDERAIATHAAEVGLRLRRTDADPQQLLAAALDLDVDLLLHEARSRIRDEALVEAIETADVGRSYVKTLATQWGLSRMSQGIALSSLAAVLVATGVVLGYERGPAAPLVVAAAIAAVLLPLTIFVSFALRFTFLNQNTLPIGHFVLGPEDPEAAAHR